MGKRLALTVDGHLTYCTASEERIGKGRCNHVDHQVANESEGQFAERIGYKADKRARTTRNHAANIEYRQLKKRLSEKMSFGDQFEDEMCERFEVACNREWGDGTIKRPTGRQDALEGTDLFIDEVRVDITLNSEKKGDIKVASKILDFGFAKVRFGIRSGNGVKKFDQKVVVMHFDVNLNRGEISTFAKMLADRDIVEIAQSSIDIYYKDEDGEEI